MIVLCRLRDGPLHPLLKFPPIFRPGDHGGNIQHQKNLPPQTLRHAALHDPTGDPLHHGRFSHAGFTDETGIVLLTAGKNADHPLRFALPSDDGIHTPCPHRRTQIPPVGGKVGTILQEILPRIPGGGLHRSAQRILPRPEIGRHVQPDFRVGYALIGDQLHRFALALSHQCHKQVLRADEAVPLPPRFVGGILDYLLQPGRHIGRAHAARVRS